MESTFTKPRWEPACVHLPVDFVIWLSFPCRSKFNCFRKLLWKERKYGNTDIQQECLKHSCKRSDSSWFLICMSQETFQSSSYRQVLALSNLEYNIYSCHVSLCVPGNAGWALDEPFGQPAEQERAAGGRRLSGKVWKRRVAGCGAGSWSLGGGEVIYGKTRGIIWKAAVGMKLITLTLLKSSSAFPGLGRSGYHSGSLFQWPSCLQR